MSDLPALAPFRGRTAELDHLRTAMEQARTSGATAVLLGGEAGVGKSRLVGEFCVEAGDAGAVALTGRALDLDDGPSFWPVVSALRAHVRTHDGAVADHLSSALERIDGPDVRTRVEMLEALRHILVEITRFAPVVLVLDDLHWADRSTRDLIVYLVASLTDEPVLLVGTYRDEATGGVPGRLAPMVGELRRHNRVSFRQVRPLARDDLAELLGGWVPDRPDLEPLVWRHSLGNVFLAEETVRAVLGGDPRGLPATVRDLVRAGVSGLTTPAQWVVRALAAGIGETSHALLTEVLARLGDELSAAVREAAEAGLVVVGADGEGYRLRHGLMVEVVAADLMPGERVELHGRFARALAAWPTRPGVAAQLAHHWQLAAEPENALAATIAAAEEAERVRGYAEAYRHWLRAASLQVSSPDSPRSRGQYLERAAESAELAGDPAEAVALLAARLSDPDAPTGGREAVLRAHLGRYLMSSGQAAEAEEAYRRAVTVLPDPDYPVDDADVSEAERVDVLAGHAAALLQLGDYSAARDVARQALEPARRIGEPAVLARVLAILGSGAAYLEDAEAGLAALDEAIAVAERADDPVALGLCLSRRADLLCGPLNALDDGVAAARAGAARMGEVGLSRTSGVALLAIAANGLFRLGRWDEADDEVARAWAAAPTGAQAIDVRLSRARLTMARGDFTSSEADLTAAELVAPATAGPRHTLPLLILRAGLEMWRDRPALAFEHVRRGLDVVESGIDDFWAVAPLLWHGARAHAEALLAGEPVADSEVRRLRQHVRELERRAERSVPAVRVVLASFVAMCAAEDDRAAGTAAPDTWADVAARLAGLRQPYPEAYSRLRSAEVRLGIHQRSTDGTADLVRAFRIASAMRAEPLLVQIRDLAARARVTLELDESPASSTPSSSDTAPAASGPLGELTRRELEVLVVMAEGLTNREIAGRLFISEKTVGVHLSRIFGKLGVRSRVQASGVLHRFRPDVEQTTPE
ncbi:helix-turn-helix transcriptional regulator [Pseudonocardia endophytica]|uniref:Putative ATPase n=1 Tax=Pseudonocardia endophytica TaxID=401976 RepID=A0A4V2PII2_PSEEN|nr:LuxR family transcriptional regulator [Pseudonocardia endophytica]TCK24666.1 putative ATPase [Pseudonocardia endophytica]